MVRSKNQEIKSTECKMVDIEPIVEDVVAM